MHCRDGAPCGRGWRAGGAAGVKPAQMASQEGYVVTDLVAELRHHVACGSGGDGGPPMGELSD